MRRFSLVLSAIALCLAATACASATAPTPRQGEWMKDGTWCSGYLNPAGECVEEGD